MDRARPRVAVIHGYFLGESGSEIYARELARAFMLADCDVTLVCQEPDAESIDFVDEAWALKDGNRTLERYFEREPAGPGTCRLVRPDLSGEILVYAPGAQFPGYVSTPMQDASPEQVHRFVDANTVALRTIFDRWPPEIVQANHVVLQPVAAGRALLGSAATLLTTFHGSELTFSLSADPRLAPYASEAIAASARVVSLSEWSSQQLTEYAELHAIPLGDKIAQIAPGVDTSRFEPVEDRVPILRAALGDDAGVARDDDVVMYTGAMRRTKGVQHALIAFARVLERRPKARLLLAGAGPHADEMRVLAQRIGRLDATGRYSRRVHFLGHQPHPRLAPLLGATDVALVPSVIPEAFALVAIEAAAAGAVPVAPFQTGMQTPVGAIAGFLDDPSLTTIGVGPRLSRDLAEHTVRVLENHPTKAPAFRRALHDFADTNFSWHRCADEYLALGRVAGAP